MEYVFQVRCNLLYMHMNILYMHMLSIMPESSEMLAGAQRRWYRRAVMKRNCQMKDVKAYDEPIKMQ